MSAEDYAQWVLEPTLPDQPTEPRCSYFVCGTPRSGTWLLCGLLASTGVAGRPHEYFWRDTERAFAQNRISPLEIRFEDLVEDPRGGVQQVLAFLELDLPEDASVAARTTKTGDALNAAWAARYRSLKGG